MEKENECWNCNGKKEISIKGSVQISGVRKCPVCDGNGKIVIIK